MAIPTYYNGFQAVRLDEFGQRIVLGSEEFKVRKVGGASLGTVTSDPDGLIESGTVYTAVGNEIQFSHADYPEVFIRVTAETAAAAAMLTENREATYIAENLYPETEPAAYAEIWRHSQAEPDMQDQLVGVGTVGEDNVFNYETLNDGVWTYYAMPVSADGRRAYSRYTQAPSRNFDTSASGRIDPGPNDPRAIFAFPDDRDSTTSTTDLHVGIAPPDTFAADMDVVHAVYHLKFAANGNSKFVKFNVADTEVYSEEITQNSGGAWLEVDAVRYDTDKLKVATRINGLDNSGFNETTVTGVDFTIPMRFALRGSSDSAADWTARSGYAVHVAAPVEDTYIEDDDGAFVIDDDGASDIDD